MIPLLALALTDSVAREHLCEAFHESPPALLVAVGDGGPVQRGDDAERDR